VDLVCNIIVTWAHLHYDVHHCASCSDCRPRMRSTCTCDHSTTSDDTDVRGRTWWQKRCGSVGGRTNDGDEYKGTGRWKYRAGKFGSW